MDRKALEQEFGRLISELGPNLKKICAKNRFLGFIDRDDLLQEALISLWHRFASGKLSGKTTSYMLRGCYFHIQNYIRTHKVKNNMVSLDEPIVSENSDVCYLRDLIKDKKGSFFQQLDSYMIVQDIMNNGLSKREKDVFALLYGGLTLREAAKKLGVSHVRVLKIKQNICLKYKDKFFGARVTMT